MRAEQSSNPVERGTNPVEPRRASRRIPHSVFGIGAFLLVLLAGLVLVVLSGQLTVSRSAVMFVVLVVPVMIAFTVLTAKRWRSARLGRN
jgi:hypothetical protein